ncbi:HpcH/HpaI aldolase/citrate lyase family protein [Kaistia terrae]|uniref:HpcH/HpaI aldolase/citrate lyase family protein n=1 Tax=Kaistia terrae TaxID=537017 RepID=A0ABW0Q142_9HYPH|nr:CoA ester lyase [Kaistia terrae]MCX5579854.1 CoA ester lyase [Kaistia terrae]
MKPIRPRRSALYVPGSNVRAMAKAPTLGADVVIFDLEDAVAPSEKEAARERVVEAVAALRQAGTQSEIVVRANGLDTPWIDADLAAIGAALPDALLLPKISRAEDLSRVRTMIGGDVALPLWAMIETPRAVLDPLDIAEAKDERLPLTVLVLGLNDLARETGALQVPGRAPMLPWMMAALAAARVAGIEILDGVFNDIADGEGFSAECLQARQCGFDGKTVIHPAQIAGANAAFAPDADELAWASRIAAVFDAPENAGKGVVRVEGRMVERLHADMAKRLLALAEAIAAKG